MTITTLPLSTHPSLAATACCICEHSLATVLVVDEAPSLILGDVASTRHFAVCGSCAEVAAPYAVPASR